MPSAAPLCLQAITALLGPATAAVGGFTNAQATAPQGLAASAATLTRLIAATANGAAAANIGSNAVSTLGGNVLSDAAGLAQAGPAGAQVGAALLTAGAAHSCPCSCS